MSYFHYDLVLLFILFHLTMNVTIPTLSLMPLLKYYCYSNRDLTRQYMF